MCIAHPRLILLIFLLFGFLSLKSISAPKGSDYYDELNNQLSFLKSELDREIESLEWAQEKLQDVEEALQDSTDELNRAENIANKSGKESDFRALRIINVKYKRHLNKVKRRTQRVDNKIDKIADIENKINLIESDLEKLKKASVETQPAEKKRAKPAAIPKPTAIPKKVALKPKSQARKTQVKQRAWPYLSEGSFSNKQYAASRINDLAEKKRKGEILESPLNKVEIIASNSFGKAKMEYIGDNLFSVVKPVVAGKQIFEVFDLREWHEVPAADNNTLYRFIFDISSVSQPKLFMFREELIRSDAENTDTRRAATE